MRKLAEYYQEQRNFVAGVILVFLLCGTLFVSYQHKQKAVPSAVLTLHATFNKADGVNVGSSVRLAGKQIGRVMSTELDEFYRVKMTFAFPNYVPLPVDSAAMIETDGLVGNKYIELLAGGDEEFLQNGDEFLYTQDVLLLDQLLERFLGWMRIKKGIVENELLSEGDK